MAGDEPETSMAAAAVERVSAKELNARAFIERIAVPGRPVVLLDIVPAWAAFREWRRADGEADCEHLAAKFRRLQGPVVDCSGARDTATWDVGEYFTWVAAQRDRDTLGYDDQKNLLYLKDWHLVQDCRRLGLQIPYEAPDYLAAPLHDWLNLYKDVTTSGCDDFRFCYAGVAGTCTLLHHDVLCSHSWSANISGLKRWVFYPPEVSPWLVDRRGDAASSAAPGRRPQGWEKQWPKLHLAWDRRLEFLQEAGELVFVPSGWYHEVENLTFAVSINHNWLNASNAEKVWGFLEAEMEAVHKTIGDLQDTFETAEEYAAQCQTLMKANCGLDLAGWMTLLAAAAELAVESVTLARKQVREAEATATTTTTTRTDARDNLWVAQWVCDRLDEVAQATLASEAVAASSGPREVVPRLVAALQEIAQNQNAAIE
ncbi:unnamed protein product [Polarella glacialis]|uniref:JmjC domain-containing protein n=1 Tax=Polarella glacialis TaxID=89957 RepID=A0A813HE20_POLGL|nr:unnamed protein product [Polarella glacialis]